MPKVGLIFEFQTRGLETCGQYSTDLCLIFHFRIFFFRSFAQPIVGHIQKRKYRKNCRGNEQMFVFHFCILVAP